MPRAIKARKRNEYGQLIGAPESWDVPLPFPEPANQEVEEGDNDEQQAQDG